MKRIARVLLHLDRQLPRPPCAAGVERRLVPAPIQGGGRLGRLQQPGHGHLRRGKHAHRRRAAVRRDFRQGPNAVAVASVDGKNETTKTKGCARAHVYTLYAQLAHTRRSEERTAGCGVVLLVVGFGSF